MKRESMRLIPGVILAVLLLVPGLALAEDSSPQSDVKLAEHSAQMWLETQAESAFPEMQGANLTSTQPYYDLEDNLICYMFAISKNGKIVGTIVVGSSLYNYDIFEVNTGSPPPMPTAAEVSSSLEEYTGLKATEEDVGKPKRLLYLGCCAEYALYQIEGQSVAIHLRTKRGAVASDLKFYMATPDEYQQHKSNRVGLGVDGEPVILNVTHKWMGNYTLYDEHRNNNNCGPTSGSMIVCYYKKEHGYVNFDDWTKCHSDPDDGTGGLYNTMKCNWPWPKEGVWPGEAGLGWVNYAQMCGYSFDYAGEYAQFDSYEDIMSYINQEAPPMILFVIGGYKDEGGNVTPDFHWNALKGYQQTADADFIFTVDPWYSPEVRQINYALCVGNLTWLTYIVAITVPGDIVGEVRDVNSNLLSNVYVSLYEYGGSFYGSDVASPDYCIEVTETGEYWLLATKYCYYPVDTRPQVDGGDMPTLRNPFYPDYIDWSTPGLLALGNVTNFVGDYGLVCKAASLSYAMESVNHYLFIPLDDGGTPQPDWRISNWKAMQSVASWQFPYSCNC
jgi:hypothetical protein